jgi:hypothetical protein
MELDPPIEARIARPVGDGPPVHIADGGESAGTKYAEYLAQRRVALAEMLEDLMRVHHIEGGVAEWQCVDAALMERDIRQAASRGVTSRVLERVVRHIEADRFARRHALGQPACDAARAAADVQNSHPRPQMRD